MDNSCWSSHDDGPPGQLGGGYSAIESFEVPEYSACSECSESAKLFYEMMEVDAVPKICNSTALIHEESHFEDDLPDESITYTTVRERCLELPDNLPGYTEWIAYADTKNKVFDGPGFPKPPPQPLGGKPMHVVCESLETTFGVFATHDIKIGELIFAERPFLVAPRALGFAPGSIVEDFNLNHINQIQWSDLEAKLAIAVDRMPDNAKEEFLHLRNSHNEAGAGPIAGIFLTNAFELGGLADGPMGTRVTDRNGYAGIARAGSKINHSCMPNTTATFDVASFSLQFFAIKDLKAGDELFYGYCNIYAPYAERRESLGRYGIVCNCPACVNSTPTSESFRRTFIQRIKKIKQEVEEWQAKAVEGFETAVSTPTLEREAVLAKVLTLQKQLVEEGLDASDHYAVIFMVLYQLYVQLGKMRRADRAFQQIQRYNALARLDLE